MRRKERRIAEWQTPIRSNGHFGGHLRRITNARSVWRRASSRRCMVFTVTVFHVVAAPPGAPNIELLAAVLLRVRRDVARRFRGRLVELRGGVRCGVVCGVRPQLRDGDVALSAPRQGGLVAGRPTFSITSDGGTAMAERLTRRKNARFATRWREPANRAGASRSGPLSGLGLWLATVVLVAKGGPNPGPHLAPARHLLSRLSRDVGGSFHRFRLRLRRRLRHGPHDRDYLQPLAPAGVKPALALDPFWWTSPETSIRCPGCDQTVVAGEPAGDSRITFPTTEEGYSARILEISSQPSLCGMPDIADHHREGSRRHERATVSAPVAVTRHHSRAGLSRSDRARP